MPTIRARGRTARRRNPSSRRTYADGWDRAEYLAAVYKGRLAEVRRQQPKEKDEYTRGFLAALDRMEAIDRQRSSNPTHFRVRKRNPPVLVTFANPGKRKRRHNPVQRTSQKGIAEKLAAYVREAGYDAKVYPVSRGKGGIPGEDWYIATDAPLDLVKDGMRYRLTAAERFAANPAQKPTPGGRVLSRRIEEVRYRHAKDGKWYKHPFTSQSTIELLRDGSFRVFSPSGKQLWGDL